MRRCSRSDGTGPRSGIRARRSTGRAIATRTGSPSTIALTRSRFTCTTSGNRWIAIGCALAIPLGIVAGRWTWVRLALDPYVEFFRFIPPIAFITLFLIWFGLGETSKILLIVYTTMFVTFLNTMTGAMSVEPEKIRAAQCLGASRRQIFVHVVVPATVPHIVTGLRLAMGNAFMTVVAAELVAAQSGVGHLIWSSRLFAQTEFVFVGIITLGLMGFAANWALRKITARLAYRYSIQL